ncbi:hypothetical protein NQ317_019608 [Molorchus minor]|uniref:E3 ubiquitin-protein ligase DCST1-like C-terminal domain-containing protein n=1 Tax=Molorchus minor TaxID=1323400 RepID=A0ABQ9J0P9_9CUCU|nr:hypothetical protein NQ317_019608 [Molorchus minor]
MRSRNSFLKFARRQLRRKVMGEKGIEKITCKEYLAANFRIFGLCWGGLQTACLLCGQVFRESDDKKPIRCQTPDCPGVYCEQCFADLQNLCTICLSPIEYGDMSDISEERDSSDEEPKYPTLGEESPEEQDETGSKKDSKDKPKDSDYYSTDDSDYSFSYQYDEPHHETQPAPSTTTFKDVEKQPISDYARMESFQDYPEEEAAKAEQVSSGRIDKGTATQAKVSVGTRISGTTFEENKKQRHINFIGIPSGSLVTFRRRSFRKERNICKREEVPLLGPAICLCDSDDSDLSQEETRILIPKSTTSTATDNLRTSASDEDWDQVPLSELDSETKDDIQYVNMLIPELDLSELTDPEPKNVNNDMFSYVTYEEISESTRSTPCSGKLTSSTVISSLDILSGPNRTLRENIKKITPSKNICYQISSSSIDSYNMANSQKERVKEYYKAVKDIPSKQQEENQSPNKLVKFFQKGVYKGKY